MSSEYLTRLPGLTNPITTAGRVVYNAVRDSIEQRRRNSQSTMEQLISDVRGTEESEDYTIQPHELCLRNKENNLRRNQPNDTDIRCFSSANRIDRALAPGQRRNAPGRAKVDAGNFDDERKRKRMKLEFAGVASNRAIYDPKNNANEEFFAVQVGGLATMLNTGKQTINAGDLIQWDLPDLEEHNRPKIEGVNRSKLLFKTVPYKMNSNKRIDDFIAARAAAAEVVGEGDDEEADRRRVALTLSNFEQSQYEDKRRIFGRALSYAEKGKAFDIVLGHYCN